MAPAKLSMNLNSAGYRSERIFTSFDGLHEDRGNYAVVRTLSNPNYFWGNLLIFDRAPTRADFANWIRVFETEFPDPRIYHVTLAWDSSSEGRAEIGDPSAFIEAGFEFETKVVLAASNVHPPPRFNDALQVRPLAGQEEWEALLQLELRSAHDHLSHTEWEKFYRSQHIRYRAMEAVGMGHWYGGFLDDRLVCSLGIFHSPEGAGSKDAGLGRFQNVATDPQFRRQGLCGTLVYKVAMLAFAETPITKLIMCADPNYFALRIYESVGFRRESTEYGVYRWDRSSPDIFIGG